MKAVALKSIVKKMPVGLMVCAGIFILGSAAPALAAPKGKVTPSTQTLYYELYAGGINGAHARLDVEYGPQEYRLFIDTRTKGFLGRIVPWVGTFETVGWRVAADDHRPRHHNSTATMRDESEKKDYHYRKDRTFVSYTEIENGKDKTPEKLDEGLVKQTTDALTATLQVMQSTKLDQTCDSISEVFDGDRRFRMIFRHDGEEMLTATQYNIYSGPAIRCTLQVEPLAGRWHSKPRGWMSIQDQNIRQGGLPTIWLAQLDENGPAIPVKTRVRTDYGTFFAHLVRYQAADQDVTAAAFQKPVKR